MTHPANSKFTDIDLQPEIIDRAARGDVKAHEIIYRSYATPVYSICLRFTRVPAQAEDLLQETFIEVMRSIGGFRGEAPLGAWIRRIAVSKALMFLRSAWHSRGRSLDDEWDQSLTTDRDRQSMAARSESAMDLDAALGQLAPVARTVVWLHDVEGYTHREIGDLMGKTESFSKSQLARAYRHLRPLLDEPRKSSESAAPTDDRLLGPC